MSSISALCPFCAQNNTRATRECIKGISIEYVMWYCQECGSEFAMPRKAASSEYYEYETPVLRWEFDVVAAYLAKKGIRAAVLDIGCADGSFVGYLKGKGIEAMGIDFNENKIERARAQGLNCQRIDVREISLEQRFAAITAFHVLEHLEEPELFLVQLKHKLCDDGLVFLSIPNPRRYHLFFRRDDPDYPPNHLARISEAGIHSLVERTDYELVWCRLEPDDTGWVRAMSHTANRLLDLLGIRVRVKASRVLNPPVKAIAYLVSLPWVAFWQLLPVRREGYTVLYCLKKKG